MKPRPPRPLIDPDLRVRPLEPECLTGQECDRVFGTTPEIRKNLRTGGEWYSPVHILWLNSRYHVYRVSMVRSYLENRHQPHVHLNEVEELLQRLSAGSRKSKTPCNGAA
jgi:hypothetical protein